MNEFPEAPDMYEQAARIILKNPEGWKKVRDELGISQSKIYRLRSEFERDLHRALKIIAIIKADMRKK